MPSSFHVLHRIAACCVLALLISGVNLPAQSAASDSSQDQDTPANPDQNLPTFKSQVNVVNLFFNVKDKHGALVPNLAKNDFQVFEDGKPQTIKYFATDSEEPLTLGILIDSSASQTRVLDMEKEVGADFLREVLRPKDEAFVISFDVEVDLLQDYTNENHQLRTALNKAKINAGTPCTGVPGVGGGPFPDSCSPKGTLLYDAVYLASYDKLSKEVGRKAMILLTDGEDQGSKERIQDAVEAAQKSDSIVYVLLIADRGFYGGFGSGYSGDHDMKKMTTETGGRVIEVGNKKEKLQEAFDEIAKELRTQYNIGYTPTNPKLDGTFRKVEIHTTEKNLKVQARTGYYAIRRDTEAGE